MLNIHLRFESNKVIRTINEELKSVYFIAFFALITLFSSLFSLELAYYTVSFIIAIFIVTLCKDMSPLIPMTAFFYFRRRQAITPEKIPILYIIPKTD